MNQVSKITPPAEPELMNIDMSIFIALNDEIILSDFNPNLQITHEYFEEIRNESKIFLTVYAESKFVTIFSKDLIATKGRFKRFS